VYEISLLLCVREDTNANEYHSITLRRRTRHTRNQANTRHLDRAVRRVPVLLGLSPTDTRAVQRITSSRTRASRRRRRSSCAFVSFYDRTSCSQLGVYSQQQEKDSGGAGLGCMAWYVLSARGVEFKRLTRGVFSQLGSGTLAPCCSTIPFSDRLFVLSVSSACAVAAPTVCILVIITLR